MLLNLTKTLVSLLHPARPTKSSNVRRGLCKDLGVPAAPPRPGAAPGAAPEGPLRPGPRGWPALPALTGALGAKCKSLSETRGRPARELQPELGAPAMFPAAALAPPGPVINRDGPRPAGGDASPTPSLQLCAAGLGNVGLSSEVPGAHLLPALPTVLCEQNRRRGFYFGERKEPARQQRPPRGAAALTLPQAAPL